MENEATYRHYGEFLINFEYVCTLLRMGIRRIIFPEETPLQKTQAEILTEGLTADPVRKKYFALIQLTNSADSEIFKLTKIISEVFGDLIPVRNSFAHGTAYIGKSDLNEFSKDGVLALKHPKIKTKGLDIGIKEFDNETLKMGIEIFKSLNRAILKIIILNDKDPIEEDEVKLLYLTGEELKGMSKKFHRRSKK